MQPGMADLAGGESFRPLIPGGGPMRHALKRHPIHRPEGRSMRRVIIAVQFEGKTASASITVS
jgi:hypothetical protein